MVFNSNNRPDGQIQARGLYCIAAWTCSLDAHSVQEHTPGEQLQCHPKSPTEGRVRRRALSSSESPCAAGHCNSLPHPSTHTLQQSLQQPAYNQFLPPTYNPATSPYSSSLSTARQNPSSGAVPQLHYTSSAPVHYSSQGAAPPSTNCSAAACEACR